MAGIVYQSEAIAPLERSRGKLRVRIGRRDATSVLTELYQEGCLKARFPRTAAGAAVSIVLLNSAGGVVPGDRLNQALTLEDGAEASLVSAGAERFYRGRRGEIPACVRTAITLGAGAALEWLPQESILFDATALDRTLGVEMEEDARLLAVEALVFGRTAMGEAVHRVDIVDRLRIRRAGRLVWQDAVRLSGDADALLQRPAMASGAGAVAGVLFAAPDSKSRLETLRKVMAPEEYKAGVTCRDGVLFARLLARDGAALRERIAAALTVLRTEPGLPRNWCF